MLWRRIVPEKEGKMQTGKTGLRDATYK